VRSFNRPRLIGSPGKTGRGPSRRAEMISDLQFVQCNQPVARPQRMISLVDSILHKGYCYVGSGIRRLFESVGVLTGARF